MDNLPTMKISQSIQHALCNLAQDFFTGSTSQLANLSIDAIKTAPFTKFHHDGNRARRLIHKRPVIPTNMVRRTVLVEVEFANDLLLDVGVWVGGDDLESQFFFFFFFFFFF